MSSHCEHGRQQYSFCKECCRDINAKVSNNGWVSVEADLPDSYKSVVVFCDHPLSGKLVVAAHYEGDGFWLVHECRKSNFYEYITHWMPLPDPPKDEL